MLTAENFNRTQRNAATVKLMEQIRDDVMMTRVLWGVINRPAAVMFCGECFYTWAAQHMSHGEIVPETGVSFPPAVYGPTVDSVNLICGRSSDVNLLWAEWGPVGHCTA